MPRDYAPKGERRKAVRRKTEPVLPGWAWLFAGLSIGMAAAAFYYIGRPASPSAVAAPAPTRADKPAAAEKKDSLELPPKEKSRFTFYELLPNQEVIVPRGEKPAPKSAAAAPAAAGGEVYYIQVGSYRTETEAERQKAVLALLGAEARIEKVTIASGNKSDTYYRVRIGPEKTMERAQSLMQRLEDNGIVSLLVRFKA